MTSVETQRYLLLQSIPDRSINRELAATAHVEKTGQRRFLARLGDDGGVGRGRRAPADGCAAWQRPSTNTAVTTSHQAGAKRRPGERVA
jgi:hypothetical protein